MNNLKQIGIALHSYADVYGHFPPAAICDKKGKKLLSWRVAILPFIGQEALYRKFKLDEPWDSPRNKPLLDEIPNTYFCLSASRPAPITATLRTYGLNLMRFSM